jgi:metal-responsive CopG/Arc/MetJ family transcriptional regulator
MAVRPLDDKSPSVLTALRLPAALLGKVDAEAKRRGLSRSALVRVLLVAGLGRTNTTKRGRHGKRPQQERGA